MGEKQVTQLTEGFSKHRWAILVLVAVLSLSLTLLSFFWLKEEEKALVQLDFARAAEGRLAAMEQAIERKFLKLRSLAVLHQSLGEIGRREFPDIIRRFAFDLDQVRTIGWIPRVSGDKRQDFEERARQELGATFQFFQLDPNGHFKSADPRPEHYPIYYRYPETDSRMLGFDIASASTPMQTLERARKQRSLAFGIVPFQSPGRDGVLLLAVYPVFMHAVDASSHGTELDGYYFILTPVGGVYQQVREQLPPVGMDVYIYAAFEEWAGNLQILFSPSRVSPGTQSSIRTEEDLRQGHFFEQRYPLGPGLPEIVYILKPTDEFVASRHSWRPLAALLGGLTFSAALVLILSLQFRHAALVHRFAMEQQRYADSLVKEVSERKRAEEQLMSTNLELERFVYTVSHDLRSPLSAIIGHAQVLQLQDRETLSDEILDSLKTIEEQGVRMNEMMEDLLSLARAGRLETPAEEVDTDAVLQTALFDHGQLIMEKSVTVSVDEMEPLRVPSSLLVQVFENLIGNALRYGCSQGGALEVGCATDDCTVTFHVRDFGSGIPEEEREKIFEVFYRGSTGQEEQGTGIGLATVRKIARQYGGDAWYEETPGGGATFFVKMSRQPPGE